MITPPRRGKRTEFWILLLAAFLFSAAVSFAGLKLAGTFTITEVMEKKVDLEGQLIRLKFNSRSGITQIDKDLYSAYLYGGGTLYMVFPKEGLEVVRKFSTTGSKGDSIYGILHSSFSISKNSTYSGLMIEAKGRSLSKNTSGDATLTW